MECIYGTLRERKHFQLTIDSEEFMQLCDINLGSPIVGECQDRTFVLYPGFSMPEQFDRVSSSYGVNAYGAYFGLSLKESSVILNVPGLSLDEQIARFDEQFKQCINSSEPIPLRFNGLPNIDLAYVTLRVEK